MFTIFKKRQIYKSTLWLFYKKHEINKSFLKNIFNMKGETRKIILLNTNTRLKIFNILRKFISSKF